MKLKIYTLLLALCVTWSLQSCDNDDDDSIAVPAELQKCIFIQITLMLQM